jgi:hypothetical protein
MKSEIRDARELLTLRRMALALGVPAKWLRERAEAGEIPGLRAGNRWLFAPDVARDAVRAMAGDPLARVFYPQDREGGAQ